MPPRKRETAAKSAARKSTQTRSARASPLTAALTKRQAAQQQKEEREAVARRTQRRIQRRQARTMELPPHPNDYKLVLTVTQVTRKRTANPPFDDRINKRRNIAQQYPWEWNNGLEQLPSPFEPVPGPLGAAPEEGATPDENPVDAMGDFAKLPTEIRDEIFRYLGLCGHEIRVLRGWSLVYPRAKPRLDLAFLYTCKVLRYQGLRILFGENTFLYDLRDPSDGHPATSRVLAAVFGNCVVPINQYGHLVRHVKIRVLANRMNSHGSKENFVNAIRKFLPSGGLLAPANIHTLTIEVTALRQCDLRWPGWRSRPDEVPICEFFEHGSRARDALLELQVQWVRVLAHDKDGRLFETVCDLRHVFKQKQMMMVMQDGGYDEQAPVMDVQPMVELWEHNVRQAKAHLCNLAWRLRSLATDPQKAVNELQLWTEVVAQDNYDPNLVNEDGLGGSGDEEEEIGYEGHQHGERTWPTVRRQGRDEQELLSLPPDWREPSSSLSASASASGDRAKAPRAAAAAKKGKARADILDSVEPELELTEEWLEQVEPVDEEDSLFVADRVVDTPDLDLEGEEAEI
ncbi:hypothetical protein F5X99DRAFT_428692 [Biscogniauxia marginata]|nr:hypothetical protein F5X99DRAFT_428692 [Biscogniauxia marginata]